MFLRGGYKVARQRAVDDFERAYLVGLIAWCTTLAAMSRVSGLSTQQLKMLLAKHDLDPRGPRATSAQAAAGPR